MGKKEIKYTTLLMSCALLASLSLAACSKDNSHPVVHTDEYAILLQYNDGASRPFTKYVEKGSSIAQADLDTPIRQGYTFANWTIDQEGNSPVSFPYTPDNDVTFYAQWDISVINVTFDYNIDNDDNAYVMEVNYNGNITQTDVDTVNATIPEWSGHVFAGYWETKNGTRVSFDTPYNIKKETTFYAHWRTEETKLYNVTFDENYTGGTTHTISDIEDGASIALKDAPSDPTRQGYTFLGWATTDNATEADVTFPYTPSGSETNITLYAVWEMKTFAVTFRYNYKKSPAANGIYQRVNSQALANINEPTVITRSGFTFLGWYTHAYEGQKVTFPYTVTSSTNLYAHWQADQMTPVNNIFDAEFTPIRSDETFPGYSGSTLGTGIIQPDGSDDFGAYSDNYPLLDDAHNRAYGNFVTYLYKLGATLTFNIHSSAAVSGVKLYARLATEIAPGGFSITPEGDYGYQFIVNNESVEYGEIDLTGLEPSEAGQSATRFAEFYVADVSLNEGWNVIQLVTNNENTSLGGTMGAVAPEVDYIRLETSAATLSWHPEYDNLYRD